MIVGIAGLGFVGSALLKSFKMKNIDVVCYDKFKTGMEYFNILLNADIIFLCLPTCFSYKLNTYNKDAIHEVCSLLYDNNYKGIIAIKSTVEPETTEQLCIKFSNLKIVHNPEFLTASSAFEDFHNQKHIVIGKSNNITINETKILVDFYTKYYPDADISLCHAIESESMKIFANSFYAVKVQFFNELYLTCQSNGADFNNVRNIMLKNGWINSMHTLVPGTDGKLSYGGYCFPKDTNALLYYMKNNDIPNAVLKGTIDERNNMREDNINTLA